MCVCVCVRRAWYVDVIFVGDVVCVCVCGMCKGLLAEVWPKSVWAS